MLIWYAVYIMVQRQLVLIQVLHKHCSLYSLFLIIFFINNGKRWVLMDSGYKKKQELSFLADNITNSRTSLFRILGYAEWDAVSAPVLFGHLIPVRNFYPCLIKPGTVQWVCVFSPVLPTWRHTLAGRKRFKWSTL